MKTINEFINESSQMIVEADCKDLRNPRKGCTIYACKVSNQTKIYALTAERVIKRKDPNSSWKRNKYGETHYIDVYFSDNELGVSYYTDIIFGSIDYKDELQVRTHSIDGESYIFGISKQILKDYIKNEASKKSLDLSKKIEELQKQIIDLENKKAEQDAIINAEIAESLNEE